MRNKLLNEYKNPIIFILFVLMLTGLFTSRALLSVALIAFTASSFFISDIKLLVKNFISTPLLWSISLLFVLPLISGIWSEDKKQWLDILRIKLPLLLLPISFAGHFYFSKKQWEILAFIFIGLITSGTIWSMMQYATDMHAVNETYLQAKTMITPLDNDHVRFSWLVAVSILLASALFFYYRKTNSMISIIILIIIAWLIIFLHLLAARTGLISFYIIAAGAAGWTIFSTAKWKQAILFLILIVSLPVAAYFIFPSFHNRVNYIRYEYDYFKKAAYLPGSNDAVRIISIKQGWHVMNDHPTGAGYGDILSETKKQYALHYPAMKEEDQILPSSEWMMYGAGLGWPGFIAFTGIMLVSFFTSIKNKLYWWLLNIIAAFSLLFDIGLEVQFGVFVYAFIILCSWKWLKAEKM